MSTTEELLITLADARKWKTFAHKHERRARNNFDCIIEVKELLESGRLPEALDCIDEWERAQRTRPDNKRRALVL